MEHEVDEAGLRRPIRRRLSSADGPVVSNNTAPARFSGLAPGNDGVKAARAGQVRREGPRVGGAFLADCLWHANLREQALILSGQFVLPIAHGRPTALHGRAVADGDDTAPYVCARARRQFLELRWQQCTC